LAINALPLLLLKLTIHSSQWTDQTNFLTQHNNLPHFIVYLFLIVNIIVMSAGSVLAIAKVHTEIAVAMLGSVIALQAVTYGMLFDANFFFRNLSVVGGLLMLLADSYASKRKTLFAGLPTLNETDKSMYIQLLGRILLVFLFLSSVMNGEFSLLRLVVGIIGFVGCVMVVVGFKAKYSAWMMLLFLSISNVVLNNWWSLHQ
jgi:hypothetical protein